MNRGSTGPRAAPTEPLGDGSRFVLLPEPRVVEWTGDTLPTATLARVVIAGTDPRLLGAARLLQRAVLEEHGLALSLAAHVATHEPCVHLTLAEPGSVTHEQGYVLRITRSGVAVSGATVAGVFYGCQTLKQLLRHWPELLPGCTIEDHPDFAARGYMLDVSRDKVPTMESLYRLVDLLAELKVNQLQLYTEHTFAYSAHESVWAQASPLTHEDVLLLDAYCRERFIELVPNQNSFGHMRRWLTLPAYRHLAEAPNGWTMPDGTWREGPFSLSAVNPACLALLAGLYDELLPHFTSRAFNVGADETWDLGQGDSRAACAQRGKGRVYLEYLMKVHELVTARGRRMQFWGDIIIQHPELVPELPSDVTVLEWGYEADHPFAEHTAAFAASGREFYVCPGTSSWNSLLGRTADCLANIESAARHGLTNGATGLLITDWGDNGHWQQQPASYVGMATGAALAWCHDANRDLDLAPAIDRHVVRDGSGTAGAVLLEAGSLHEEVARPLHNATILHRTLRAHPNDVHVLEGAEPAGFERALAAANRLLEQVPSIRSGRPDAELLRREIANGLQLLAHACAKGSFMLGGSGTTAALAADLRRILGEYRELWVARNRVGGLDDSTRRLEALQEEYGG